MREMERIREFLKRAKRDCMQLKKSNQLTAEGYGMLIQIQAIEKMLGKRF